MKLNPELIQQQIFFDWLFWQEKIDERLKSAHHVPNGLHIESRQMRAWMKRAGLRSGVWDVNIPIPVGIEKGLWLEFKVGRNELTVEQKTFGQLMHLMGFRTRIAWSGKEGIQHAKEYLYGTKT